MKLRVLGVMTGTSCDGLDAACVEFSGKNSWKPLWSRSASYPPALRRRVLDFQKPGARAGALQWLELHRDLGDWYAQTLKNMISRAGAKPDLIANHGQTVSHFPDSGMTLQLGEPTRIASMTGITVACQFRDGDMAAGGQGAPLLPRFHRMLAASLGDGVAIHNLGGISNLTYVHGRRVLAFDTGPANIWIDQAVREMGSGRYDTGGKIASRGTVDLEGAAKVLKHPYFARGIPKSTGRDDFPYSYFRDRSRARGPDLVATATFVTARSIADAYRKFVMRRGPLREIYFSGGGARNRALLAMIQRELPEVRVRKLSDVGFDEQLIEAQGFAVFGALSLMGESLGGEWTGVRGFGPPAHIVPAKNWLRLLRKLAP